jgi:nucleotide-binding universal stress UspA family protein
MSTASVEFHYQPDTPTPDVQHAVKIAQDFLTTVEADPATPTAVVDYAKQRLAALTAKPAHIVPATDNGPTQVSPPPTPMPLTANEADLEQLITSATAKLEDLRVRGYVQQNERQAQQQIEAVRAGMASCDKSILRFDQLIDESLVMIDDLIEQPVGVAMFGVPLISEANARLQSAALAFVQLRRSRHQQRISRQNLEARLADLERIQARNTAR